MADAIEALAAELGTVAATMRQEMRDRLRAYEDQLAGLLTRIAAAELANAAMLRRLEAIEAKTRAAPALVVRNDAAA